MITDTASISITVLIIDANIITARILGRWSQATHSRCLLSLLVIQTIIRNDITIIRILINNNNYSFVSTEKAAAPLMPVSVK